MTLIRVALDVPLARLFDYRCEDPAVRIGARVLVPFGKRQQIGIVVAHPATSEITESRLKRVITVLEREPLLQRADLRLLEFAAGYYVHPLGAVIMATLPAALRRIRIRTPEPAAYALTAAGCAVDPEALPPRARAQRALLTLLRTTPVVDAATLRSLGNASRAALKLFLAQQWVHPTSAPATLAAPSAAANSAPVLTAGQTAAAAAITSALGTSQALLLLGITGSGKTEVYLHAIAAALAKGGQILLMVPEIALTPQLESLIIARFPAVQVVTLHSGLADGERATRWLAAGSGQARIVLGTRLSVFTPLPALALIIVDEEHDASFKQGEGFRYSARDLAVVRARYANVPVVLGSATPALETYRNAIEGRYQLLTLQERIHALPPAIACIDLRQNRVDEGLSAPLLAAIGKRLDRGEQSMVFINRRGYAPVLMCGSCSWMSDCPHCSARLVLHQRDRQLRCHHCGQTSPVPATCPECGDTDLAPVGQGTQRIEAALNRHFPQARILRIDRDTLRAKAAWRDMRERIHDRAVDILVGTQVLAKGHDFPHLNLVGIVNADGMLYSMDFRAAERLYALLTQVAGRAGRGATQGAVLVQTQFPEHPLYRALRDQNFDAFAREMLAERRQAGFPPYMHQALLRVEARELKSALQFLERAAHAAHGIQPTVTLYEPVPANMMRKAGRERAHLLVQATTRADLRLFLNAWQCHLAELGSAAVRWALDVDPAEF